MHECREKIAEWDGCGVNATHRFDLFQSDFNAFDAHTSTESTNSGERSTNANYFEALRLCPDGTADVDASRPSAGKTEYCECIEERTFELERYAGWNESDEARDGSVRDHG